MRWRHSTGIDYKFKNLTDGIRRFIAERSGERDRAVEHKTHGRP